MLTDPRAFEDAGRRYALATACIRPEANDDGHAEEIPRDEGSFGSGAISGSGEGAFPPGRHRVGRMDSKERKR